MSISTHDTTTTKDNTAAHRNDRDHGVETRDRGIETRKATKTTEFFVYLAAVAAIIVTAFVVGDDGDNTADPFSAEHALRYITFLTIGYMLARGLAKSGTRSNARDNA
jgi:hypothetical protein